MNTIKLLGISVAVIMVCSFFPICPSSANETNLALDNTPALEGYKPGPPPEYIESFVLKSGVTDFAQEFTIYEYDSDSSTSPIKVPDPYSPFREWTLRIQITQFKGKCLLAGGTADAFTLTNTMTDNAGKTFKFVYKTEKWNLGPVGEEGGEYIDSQTIMSGTAKAMIYFTYTIDNRVKLSVIKFQTTDAAHLVPEPATIISLLFGGLGIIARRRMVKK